MKNNEKFSTNIMDKLVFYVSSLILVKGRKTCTNLSKLLNLSHDFLYRLLSKLDIFSVLFSRLTVSQVCHATKEKEGWLIIDDTVISKLFSKLISGVCDLYNSSLGRPDRGFCIVVLVWTNGKITIPIKFGWLFSKEVFKEKYKTKSEIAITLLKTIDKSIPYKYFLADAHYATKKTLLPFLLKARIKFVMKIPCNRKIFAAGIDAMLKKHPALKPVKNSRSIRIKASYGENTYYFASIKRKNTSGDYQTMYLISNMDVNAKELLAIYEGRWHIEVMFRSLKQSLGLCECQARDIAKQETHIYLTFLSYNFLQNEKNNLNLKNPEQVIQGLVKLKPNLVIQRITAFERNFMCIA